MTLFNNLFSSVSVFIHDSTTTQKKSILEVFRIFIFGWTIPLRLKKIYLQRIYLQYKINLLIYKCILFYCTGRSFPFIFCINFTKKGKQLHLKIQSMTISRLFLCNAASFKNACALHIEPWCSNSHGHISFYTIISCSFFNLKIKNKWSKDQMVKRPSIKDYVANKINFTR